MSAVPERKMTVDEFLAWAETQPGRHELYDGVAYAMSPERLGHADMKLRVVRAMGDAIKGRGLQCHALPDGMTVRVGRNSAYEPDALVYCGPKLPRDAIEVPNPVIVVEVLSPSTRHIDAAAKLFGYFQLESVRHCIIVDPDKRLVIQHQRRADGQVLTSFVPTGAIRFDPPGIEFDVADLYPPDEFPPDG